MCLAQPGRVVEVVDPAQGRVEVLGRPRPVNLMLLPDIRVGEWVLVELGFAVQRISEADALAWARLLEEMTASPQAREGAGP